MRTLVLLLLLTAANFGTAQDCPKNDPNGPSIPSTTRPLNGQLIYHDNLRQWFELKLDQPACGQTSIELSGNADKPWRTLEILRGCQVVSNGKIDTSGTGYYSLDLFQDVTKIVPTGDCQRQKPFPNYSYLRPKPGLRAYHVAVKIHYQTDGPLQAVVTYGSVKLTPWQAYASYFFTGGFVLYAYCGKGFSAHHVTGTPEGKPSIDDGYVAFDPESIPNGVEPILLSYDCRASSHSPTNIPH